MVEVVADGNEWETLLQELLNAVGTEKEDAQDDVVLLRGFHELAGHVIQSGDVYILGNSYFS